MSGGIAYIWQPLAAVEPRVNREMVDIEALTDAGEKEEVRQLLAAHAWATGSTRARELLERWPLSASGIVKIMPQDYRRALAERVVIDWS
jgi:glutamate synthase domain-containing protein 3